MRKQPSRGHISVKGPTYSEFRRVCQSRNVGMGPTMDALIVAELDRLDLDQVTPPGHVLGVSVEQFLAVFHHEFSVPNPPDSFCVIGEGGKAHGMQGTAADVETSPTKEEAFSDLDMPEIRSEVWDDGGDFRVYLVDKEQVDETYHVKVEPEVYPKAVVESIVGELSKPGLFSPEALEAAVPSPQREHRAARGTKPVLNADDLPSCIDTTFGKR
jgi:hypothetical protein